MKRCENFGISCGPKQMAGRVAFCLAPALAAAFLAAGCHKAQDVTTPAPPAAVAPDTNQNNQASTPVYTPQAPPPPPQPTQQAMADPETPSPVKANGQPDLHVLYVSVQHWVFAHQRAPSSFAEFASSADVTVPPPPPGKKYAFGTHYQVILVDANQH